MIETLLEILKLDVIAPEILLEEDGDICLDYSGEASISITLEGKVAWAFLTSRKHGTDLDEFKKLIQNIDFR